MRMSGSGTCVSSPRRGIVDSGLPRIAGQKSVSQNSWDDKLNLYTSSIDSPSVSYPWNCLLNLRGESTSLSVAKARSSPVWASHFEHLDPCSLCALDWRWNWCSNSEHMTLFNIMISPTKAFNVSRCNDASQTSIIKSPPLQCLLNKPDEHGYDG